MARWGIAPHTPFEVAPPFQFLDTPRLIDAELELIQPSITWIDPYLASCRHRLTRKFAPSMAKESRGHLLDVLEYAPLGRFIGQVPGYHFWMRIANAPAAERIAGSVTLRIGNSADLEQLVGHIGYQVFPASRGHHYAERASRLVLPLAKAHGMDQLWITCNPDNIASRRTCQRLGAEMIEIIPVPPEHELFTRGDKEKCRYRLRV